MQVSRLPLAVACAAAVSLILPNSAAGQAGYQPEPVPMPPPIAAPVDTTYPGTIALHVNLTNMVDRVATVHEEIPVKSGDLTLLYPQWIPGNHSPTGPIDAVAGLVVAANGQRIPWVRDRVNVYAFHIDVPKGVSSINVDFDYLSPTTRQEGRIQFSSKLADLAWNTVVLYPAGHFSRDIHFTPSIVLPHGWQYATALETDSKEGDTVHFKDTTLNMLVDSPLVAGEYFRRIDLSTGPDNPVYLDVVGDEAKDVDATPEEVQLHKNLAVQAQKLFASHHYNHYDFLFFLTDVVGGEGLEHHQSSEDGTRANYFTDWNAQTRGVDLLAHEYTHSWNGKFRRPADLWTPNFNVPMRDDLLWVYEGLTEYWGYVLSARAGMRSPEATRDSMAGIAASFETDPGRKWRPLVDTTNQPTMSQRRPVPWVTLQRQEDYYMEGLLIWLDADTKIRELSNGQKSLDDFAKAFYGIDNGSFVTHTYTFEDVVDALNKVQPFDWTNFFRTRVYDLHPEVPEGGFTQGGYKLVYNDTPPAWERRGGGGAGAAAGRFGVSYATSLGLSVMPDGTIAQVVWDGPAFKAGLVEGAQIVAIDGDVFAAPKLKDAIVKAEKGTEPITLIVKENNTVKTVSLDYHDGLRVPHLERVESTPDRLDDILKAVQ
ncbi:MAG TPA: peptidase M61 [Acidobacteriaceae bacterium]|nr:peptidase M61 [Acidobacteriaceae bacterium]